MMKRQGISGAALAEPTETQAVLRVGDGRGFVVEHRRQRVVITAAHCLPHDADGRLILPPAHPFSYLQEKTWMLLGPLGAEPTVLAECLFVDPVADIAVLGSPDTQALIEEAEAYEKLVGAAKPLLIADAPKQGREWVKLPSGGKFGGGFFSDIPGRCAARVLALDGKWLNCAIERRGKCLSVENDDNLFVGGMSGSPILLRDGRAIGLVSTGGLNPVLRDCLPAWFFRR
jgi:hypothetical protein